jgi:DNA-binding HxlR family transcriptional regulator
MLIATLQDGTMMKPGHSEETMANDCVLLGSVLERIGDKWSILIVHMLAPHSMRFSELKRALGSISQKVLTSTLRGLERDGYVTRTVTPTRPPRADYELTDLGRDVLSRVTALAQWAHARRHDVDAARSRFDARAARP